MNRTLQRSIHHALSRRPNMWTVEERLWDAESGMLTIMLCDQHGIGVELRGRPQFSDYGASRELMDVYVETATVTDSHGDECGTLNRAELVDPVGWDTAALSACMMDSAFVEQVETTERE